MSSSSLVSRPYEWKFNQIYILFAASSVRRLYAVGGGEPVLWIGGGLRADILLPVAAAHLKYRRRYAGSNSCNVSNAANSMELLE